jgi:hypothetical protein
MSGQSLRIKVVDEARRAAAGYYQEFHCPIANGGQDWVIKQWTRLRDGFALSPTQAMKLWPAYWEAFCEETTRLAANNRRTQ